MILNLSYASSIYSQSLAQEAKMDNFELRETFRKKIGLSVFILENAEWVTVWVRTRIRQSLFV